MGVVALLVVPADLVFELEQLMGQRAGSYFTTSLALKDEVDRDIHLHRAEEWVRMAEVLKRFRAEKPLGNDLRRT